MPIKKEKADLLFHHLIEHHLFEKVFGEYEYLPSAKRVKPECQCFWNEVWKPLTEQLAAELNKVQR
jgi:hypothetical protein